MKMTQQQLISAALTIVAILLSTGCMVNPVTMRQEFNIVSEDKELQIGRAVHQQLIQQFGYYHNAALQNYVNDVGQRLARVSRRPNVRYTFTVLDTEMENAFAVPGGYVYITRGLLALINSEAELAGVLGHEIGHIVNRDSAALMSRGMVAQLATLAGVAGAAASSSASGGDLAVATNQLFNSIMLGFSREREYMADEQAVEYTFKAGYDPRQITNFMRNLSRTSQGPAGVQQYLSTHPYIFDRIARVESKAKTMLAMDSTMAQLQNRDDMARKEGLILSEQYKKHIDGLAFGPRESMRRIKIYRVRHGDCFSSLARRTMGTTQKAGMLAYLNGMHTNTQLVPGATIKTFY